MWRVLESVHDQLTLGITAGADLWKTLLYESEIFFFAPQGIYGFKEKIF